MKFTVNVNAPEREYETRTQTVGIGETVILRSSYKLDLPGMSGLQTATHHRVSAKVLGLASDGRIEMEITTDRETWLERDGVRLMLVPEPDSAARGEDGRGRR